MSSWIEGKKYGMLLKVLRIYWKIKWFLDFSRKEKVNGITVVVVGRNDNYGGDFSLRLKTTFEWNLRHLPNPELIYIEWNPMEGKASDCIWITEKYPQAKCYIVPPTIHKKIAANPVKMPVMEYYAKNLGIRMAGNDWVLLINADCLLGFDTIRNIKHLSKDFVYGTHYTSIRWDQEPINQFHLTDPSKITIAFPADWKMRSVVGNFILTHRSNWLRSTGYDERMNNSRAGMDTNGLMNLLHIGLKPMALGHHFHLDHPESIVNSSNATHGNNESILHHKNIPYRNPDYWGLQHYSRKEIARNIWELFV